MKAHQLPWEPLHSIKNRITAVLISYNPCRISFHGIWKLLPTKSWHHPKITAVDSACIVNNDIIPIVTKHPFTTGFFHSYFVIHHTDTARLYCMMTNQSRVLDSEHNIIISNVFSLKIFLMWTIFKVFIGFVTLYYFFLCFVFFFGKEACGILAPWPGIEPTLPALQGKVLTTGPPGKSPK